MTQGTENITQLIQKLRRKKAVTNHSMEKIYIFSQKNQTRKKFQTINPFRRSNTGTFVTS